MPRKMHMVLILVGLGVAGFTPRARAQGPSRPVAVERVTRASNETIEKRIDDLEARPAPESRPGTISYERVTESPVTEYLCPVCGAKSFYPLADGQTQTPLNDLEMLREGEREAQASAEKLGAVVSLDETQFCRQCLPDFEGTPHAVLVTRLPNGRQKRTEDCTVRDLWILRDFFSGKDVVVGAQGDEEPLKDQLPRLRELMLVLPK